MDDKDFRLLAELFRNPLATHVQLGRAASVSSTSARRRLQGLEDEQVIAGFFALPAASTLARAAFVATATGELSASLYPMRLLERDEVVWAVRKHDGAVTVCVYLPKDTDPANVGLTPDAGWNVSQPQGGPEDELSELDWRIIDVLIDDPRADVSELARRTGLTVRAAGSRRHSLLRSGALEVRPVLLAPQGPGLLVFDLSIRLRSKDAANVRQAVEGGLIVREVDDPPGLVFLCRARSIIAVQDLQRRVAALPGVEEVWFALNREAAIARDRLHRWVGEAAAKRERAKPSRRTATPAP